MVYTNTHVHKVDTRYMRVHLYMCVYTCERVRLHEADEQRIWMLVPRRQPCRSRLFLKLSASSTHVHFMPLHSFLYVRNNSSRILKRAVHPSVKGQRHADRLTTPAASAGQWGSSNAGKRLRKKESKCSPVSRPRSRAVSCTCFFHDEETVRSPLVPWSHVLRVLTQRHLCVPTTRRASAPRKSETLFTCTPCSLRHRPQSPGRTRPRCPPRDEWIKETQRSYVVEYRSSIRKGGISPPPRARMNTGGPRGRHAE